ncbi:hypothetical protein ACHAPU_007168 [Fusarium lateritium]
MDSVMQGRPRASTSRLIQLPAELLAGIVDLLSNYRPSLASLALVNNDCRQLARCYQFAEVDLDYSPQVRQLISRLAQESRAQSQKPSIAPCIRRVTFASRTQYLAQEHRQLYESIFGQGAESVTNEERTIYRDESNSQYNALRALAYKAISTMSNLETFIWRDGQSLDSDFIQTVTRCGAQHVELDMITIDEAWPLRPPLTPPPWPLRSLDLRVHLASRAYQDLDDGRLKTHPMTNFYRTLFQLCSPTLESLTWSYMETDFNLKLPLSIGDDVMSFPRLRHLRLAYLKLDSVAVSSFLASGSDNVDTGEGRVPDLSGVNIQKV